jgi:hypothetical protein
MKPPVKRKISHYLYAFFFQNQPVFYFFGSNRIISVYYIAEENKCLLKFICQSRMQLYENIETFLIILESWDQDGRKVVPSVSSGGRN